MEEAALTRREITRKRTLDEIRGHAKSQLSEGGPEAISLNAIAKAMGMSGPAIYRYYDSRDELIADLVREGYEELAETMVEALASVADDGYEAQLYAVSRAYRKWAVGNPYRFAMFYGVRTNFDVVREEAIDASQASMNVVLMLLGQATDAAKKTEGEPSEFERQLVENWICKRDTPQDYPPEILKLGLFAWTRLHGIVTLELAGIFEDMEVDAGLACDDEIATLIEAARGL